MELAAGDVSGPELSSGHLLVRRVHLKAVERFAGTWRLIEVCACDLPSSSGLWVVLGDNLVPTLQEAARVLYWPA